ncbi:MAG TPA: class I SAM-dependent methyltransferase [Gemmatimonadaceae bacterium]
MRPSVLHAVRDQGGDGNGVRRLPRARLLLRKKPEWWESAFDDHYLLEYGPLFTPASDRQQTARLLDLLGLPVGARLLDVPCGQGRHAHLLAEAGYNVDGLDYSRELLAVARTRGTGPMLRYTRGDMREMPARWKSRFDAVLNLFTSFGFFAHPSEDVRVVREFARVLKPGGLVIWHGGSRDGVMARFLARDWWTSGNTLFAQEREFDSLSGVLTVTSTWKRGSRTGTREHRLRLYTATRLSELFADAGLVVEQAYDGFTEKALTRTASEMLLVARKE